MAKNRVLQAFYSCYAHYVAYSFKVKSNKDMPYICRGLFFALFGHGMVKAPAPFYGTKRVFYYGPNGMILWDAFCQGYRKKGGLYAVVTLYKLHGSMMIYSVKIQIINVVYQKSHQRKSRIYKPIVFKRLR